MPVFANRDCKPFEGIPAFFGEAGHFDFEFYRIEGEGLRFPAHDLDEVGTESVAAGMSRRRDYRRNRGLSGCRSWSRGTLFVSIR